ncbi:MAG: DUF4065 domain-containing protein [Acetatifactor sp.]|nr:DUF4065 domain-containing protein [Acetatifactor sp.]
MEREEKKTLLYNCPFCEEMHEVQIKDYWARTTVKEEEVEYQKTVYYCGQSDEEFTPADIMDVNLLKARDAYRRKKNFLTSGDIKAIRTKYDLTQKEYARLLGVGDATIQRYETKAIQDNIYDNLMRLTNQNPSYCLELLEQNKAAFESARYEQIKRGVAYQIKLYGEDFYLEEAIKVKYVDYDDCNSCNGYILLSLDKVKNLLVYFATYIPELYKVKLMKLLWYTDAESYRQYGHSITGLVYQHMPLGAVPIAHNEIMGLGCIKVEEQVHDDYVAQRVYPNKNISINNFSIEELGVLQRVTEKFIHYSTKKIVEYMHEETAYKCTGPNEIIEFTNKNKIRNL